MKSIEYYAIWILMSCVIFICGFVSILLVTSAYETITSKPELACRDGKLFEVTHEGNITIYDPTFDDCEVKE